MAAARATETFRPARLEKIVPTLLVCAEPRLEAWQVGRKIGRQHAMPSRLLGSILSQPAENSSLKVAERQSLQNQRILLANSPEQNPCGKICSHHGTRLDKNRISVLSCSTIIHNKTRSCRLVVISPAVSQRFQDISFNS